MYVGLLLSWLALGDGSGILEREQLRGLSFLYTVIFSVKICKTHVFIYHVHGKSRTLWPPRALAHRLVICSTLETLWTRGNAYALETILRKDCIPEQSSVRFLNFRHLPVTIKLIMGKKKKSLVKMNFSWFGSFRWGCFSLKGFISVK